MWHIPFNTGEYIDFGRVITVAVKVWSWKLWQIKDPLAFGAAFRGSVIQDITLHTMHRASKQRTDEHDDQTTPCSTMFRFTEPQIAAPNTNGSLIWHNFQDQTSTAKVAISPKNIRKMPQILLNMLFWKINLIKMMKIFICEINHWDLKEVPKEF